MGSKPESGPGRPRLLRWVSWIAFGLVCAAVAGIVLVLTVLPRLTGGAALNVLTGSMTPGIPVGSVVLIRPVDPGTLRVGDVATYQISPESHALVTHRIIKIKGSGEDLRFVFKGDANRGPDSTPVPPQAIRGEVWFHVPVLGSLRDAAHGMNAVVLLAPPLLGGYAAFLLLGGVRDRRRSRPAAAATAPRELVIDRPLVVAWFDRTPESAPGELARGWGGLVLEDDDDGFALLIAPPTDGLAAALELLATHGPREVRVIEAPAWLAGDTRTVLSAAPAEEVPHA